MVSEPGAQVYSGFKSQLQPTSQTTSGQLFCCRSICQHKSGQRTHASSVPWLLTASEADSMIVGSMFPLFISFATVSCFISLFVFLVTLVFPFPAVIHVSPTNWQDFTPRSQFSHISALFHEHEVWSQGRLFCKLSKSLPPPPFPPRGIFGRGVIPPPQGNLGLLPS